MNLKFLWNRPRTRITARVIADSVNPARVRCTTMEGVFNRYLLAEFNTHRIFSRNSASSRAIPVKKMLAQVLWDPAVPIHWGANQAGMQAKGQLTGVRRWLCRNIFLLARFPALILVWFLTKLGLHKQVANRLLEPWVWHTVVFTATDFRNFFKLRLHPDAQPEFQEFARCCKEAYDASTPKRLEWGEWHLPYMTTEDITAAIMYDALNDATPPDGSPLWSFPSTALVSAARCAAVSYVRQGEKRDVAKDITLAMRLSNSGHWSPFEHVAMADEHSGYTSNFHPTWTQMRKWCPGEAGHE